MDKVTDTSMLTTTPEPPPSIVEYEYTPSENGYSYRYLIEH